MVVPLIVPPINAVAHEVAKHPIGEQAIVEPNIVAPLYEVALEAPAIVNDPVIKTEPVNVCLLFKSQPKLLDPLEYIMLEVTCCTFKVCAIIWPVTVKLPVMLCVSLKLLDPVVA